MQVIKCPTSDIVFQTGQILLDDGGQAITRSRAVPYNGVVKVRLDTSRVLYLPVYTQFHFGWQIVATVLFVCTRLFPARAQFFLVQNTDGHARKKCQVKCNTPSFYVEQGAASEDIIRCTEFSSFKKVPRLCSQQEPSIPIEINAYLDCYSRCVGHICASPFMIIFYFCSVECKPVECNIADIKLNSATQVNRTRASVYHCRLVGGLRTIALSVLAISSTSSLSVHSPFDLRKPAGSWVTSTRWRWPAPQDSLTSKVRWRSSVRRGTASKISSAKHFRAPLLRATPQTSNQIKAWSLRRYTIRG